MNQPCCRDLQKQQPASPYQSETESPSLKCTPQIIFHPFQQMIGVTGCGAGKVLLSTTSSLVSHSLPTYETKL